MTIKPIDVRYLTYEDIQPTDPTEKKIRSFGSLPHGWNYGSGRPPTKDIQDLALRLNAAARSLGLFHTDAFPGTDGEIAVCVYHGSHYLEFTVEVDGSITFYHELDDEETSLMENLTIDDAKVRLSELGTQKWNWSDSSLTDISIHAKPGSTASPSRTQGKNPASLSLTAIAYVQPVRQFASTSKPTTAGLPANRLSTGYSPRKLFQTATP